jgi:hypothetical protein
MNLPLVINIRQMKMKQNFFLHLIYFNSSHRWLYQSPIGLISTRASGIPAVTEQEELAVSFPSDYSYREDSKYSIARFSPCNWTVHAVVGSFVVDLPIDYANNANSKFYLKLVDDNGNY